MDEVVVFHDSKCRKIAKVEHIGEGVLVNDSEKLFTSESGNYKDDERRRKLGENIVASASDRLLRFCNENHYLCYDNWRCSRKVRLEGIYDTIVIHQYRKGVACTWYGDCIIM